MVIEHEHPEVAPYRYLLNHHKFFVNEPTVIETQWVWPMDINELKGICERRMCSGLIQPETNYVVRLMRDAYVSMEPWTDPIFRSSCEKKGQCTGGGMLFPACGSFSKKCERCMGTGQLESDDSGDESWWDCSTCAGTGDNHREMIEFDPEKHLYHGELNSGMMFAEYDIARNACEKQWEEEYPNSIHVPVFPMSVEPRYDKPMTWRDRV